MLIVFGGSYPPLFRAIAWLVAGVGLALLAATAAGWLPAGYLRFDPEGFTVAHRSWRYTIPWDAVAELGPGELYDNPVLCLWLRDFGAVRVEPSSFEMRARKQFASNERWTGAHVVIMTPQYGLELPLLVSALRRYVEAPSSRAALGTRAISS